MDTEEIVIVVLIIAVFAVFGYFMITTMQEKHRQDWIVCNSDHIAENLTQYCLSQSAINTTLWSEKHK